MQQEKIQPASADIELSIVVPVYQEETALPIFLARIQPVLERITTRYEIIFSMDPGKDRTQDVIEAAMAKDARIRLLIMTRRWGQNACMIAGIEYCRGQACVMIDVDLQDPPELIVDMVKKWKEGFEVVYGERRSRSDPLPRRVVAYVGYWVLNRISEVTIPRNVGDFRLIDRKVMEGLRHLKETHGFLRGLVPYVGYRQTSIPFDREERKSGTSKYGPIVGSIRHGWDGIVAFSIVPLSFVTTIGLTVAGLGAVMTIVYIVVKAILNQPLTTGLGPILLLVTFLGGIQLICLGVMGEYLGRIYEEVRARPKYLVARAINFPPISG